MEQVPAGVRKHPGGPGGRLRPGGSSLHSVPPIPGLTGNSVCKLENTDFWIGVILRCPNNVWQNVSSVGSSLVSPWATRDACCGTHGPHPEARVWEGSPNSTQSSCRPNLSSTLGTGGVWAGVPQGLATPPLRTGLCSPGAYWNLAMGLPGGQQWAWFLFLPSS